MIEDNEPLPTPTLQTPEDLWNEFRIAREFAIWHCARSLKIGKDDPRKQKPRVDCCLFKDDQVFCFFEVRLRNWVFGNGDGWRVAKSKVNYLRSLYDLTRVPVYFVIEFKQTTLAFLDCRENYQVLDYFGPGRGGEVELGAQFEWKAFKVIRS